MLLTLTTTHRPATDLGFLLHKHPDRVHSFDLSCGHATVFYPEATPERCTAALLLDLSPGALTRLYRGQVNSDRPLAHYVNDRPYAATSFLSTAIGRIFGTALSGRCKEKPELAELAIPLVAELPAVPCERGPEYLRALFAPLGYRVDVETPPLDASFPEWGAARHHRLRLSATCKLSDLLTHIYVLVPALDRERHYYIGEDEVEKLLRHGDGWLAQHPRRDDIVRRYLLGLKSLTMAARERLVQTEAVAGVDVTAPDPNDTAEPDTPDTRELALEQPLALRERRYHAALGALTKRVARRIVDLGCGDGGFLKATMGGHKPERLVGVDVSRRQIDQLRSGWWESLPEYQKQKVELAQGSLVYRDKSLRDFDAAVLLEVIEHINPDRLEEAEDNVFGCIAAPTVIVTTPNREYNALFPRLASGALRHPDHRFEWTRAEFRAWADGVATRHGYAVRFEPVGDVHEELGAPTQMAVFTA